MYKEGSLVRNYTNHQEKYRNPSVCDYYLITSNVDKEYSKYSYIFGCHGYFVAFEEQNVSYCEKFIGEIKNYCYISIAGEYNKLRTIKANPLVIHQTSESINYFRPKPNITYVCNNVVDSALKNSCEYIFNQFNSLETPTLD